jgi:hypothetical protein
MIASEESAGSLFNISTSVIAFNDCACDSLANSLRHCLRHVLLELVVEKHHLMLHEHRVHGHLLAPCWSLTGKNCGVLVFMILLATFIA